MITKALINRFLKNECTKEEQASVRAFLDAHPEALEQLLPEEEFQAAFQPQLATERGEAIYERLRRKVFLRRGIINRLKYGLIAAASVALVVFAFRITSWQRQDLRKNKAIAQLTADTAVHWVTRGNSSMQHILITLPDSSRVTLEPGAELSFRSAFTRHQVREVLLKGKALFDVKKDQQHPFTVVSDEISTTALGTSFTVSAPENSTRIIVHLYTGKVVVAASGVAKGWLREAYYLAPGDELIYERGAGYARINSAKALKDPDEITTAAGAQPGTVIRPDWYKFGNQPLSEVIEQLSYYYNVKINYRKSEIANRYFTGRFSVTDSVEVVLRDIALLHDLKLTKAKGVYMLRKRP